MFDFGFSELVVICVVALVVLGPTRLPGVVRKIGRWVGKARSMAREFREQLENEVNVEELNRAVKRQVMDEAPTSPPPEAGMSTPSAAPADVADPFANSGYPYGVPTDTSASSADPALTEQQAPHQDDTYSHAHAPDAAPEPWNPEPDTADSTDTRKQDA